MDGKFSLQNNDCFTIQMPFRISFTNVLALHYQTASLPARQPTFVDNFVLELLKYKARKHVLFNVFWKQTILLFCSTIIWQSFVFYIKTFIIVFSAFPLILSQLKANN